MDDFFTDEGHKKSPPKDSKTEEKKDKYKNR